MKKLIPAICMLLVAASLLGTSTYAWFSMNKTVTATGMQVTAKSDSVYLLIGSGETDTLEEIQEANKITTALTIGTEDAKVFPSAHETVANTTAALSAGNWYYQVADDPTASVSHSEKKVLGSLDGYVLHKVVYVTLAKGSSSANNLKVTGATITSNATATGGSKTLTPVKILVTSSTAVVELDSTHTSSDTPLATTVTDGAVIQLDIFIYYNGADEAVYTNNIANLDGAKIDLTFGVD